MKYDNLIIFIKINKITELFHISAPNKPTEVNMIRRSQRSIAIRVIVPNPESYDSLNITSTGQNFTTKSNKTYTLLDGLEPGRSYNFSICSIYKGIESTECFLYYTATGTEYMYIHTFML